MNEDEVRNITRKFLDEEHLLDFIKIFEKEHNLFRGSHDKIQLPAALNVPQQIVNTISKKIKLEDLEDVSIPTKAVGDFIQYNETTEKWTRQAALTEGSIVIAIADGYFSEDNTNLTWDNTSKIFKVIGSTFLDGAVVINDSNADVDFRVEGSGASYTHLLFVDASANMVGINEDVPKALLHIRHGTCADYVGVHPSTALLLEGTTYVALQLQASASAAANIVFADDNYNPPAGRIQYNFNSEEMNFAIGGNVLVYFTTTGARFVQNALELDSTGYAVFIADSHNDNAYIELQEDNVIKWTIGFNYSESLNFQISAGLPGTNVCLEIETTLIKLYLDVGIWGSQDLRFYGADDHYVGFKVPAGLIGDQIWLLPTADGPANEVLGTDGGGSLIWRTHDELAGFVANEHIDHTAVSITAGTGLTGGGTIAANRTLNVDVGIADDKIVQIDGSPSDDEYAKFTANGLEGRTYANVLSDIGGAASGHNMSTHGDISTYSINTSGTLTAGNATLGTIGCGNLTVTTSINVGARIITPDISRLDLYSSGVGGKNWAMLTNIAAAGDFALKVSTNTQGNPQSAGSYVIYGTSTGTIKVNDDLTLSVGSIISDSGSISFSDENLSTTGTISATTAKLSNLTDGYVPYHVDDATGLANSLIFTAGTNVGIGILTLTSARLAVYNNVNDAWAGYFLNAHANGIGLHVETGASAAEHAFRVSTGAGASKFVITGAGNVGTEQTTFGTNATSTLALGTGVAPTTSPADCFQMYSADQVAGNACLHTRTENGAVIKLYQQAHIIDADGQLADITTKFNTLLSYLENNGLLASA